MDWTPLRMRKLAVVRAIAETGTVSAAAAALNLSQPAASRALASIEAILEVALFQRSPTRMRPTEAGLRLVERIVRAHNHLAAAEGRRGRTRGGTMLALAPDHEIRAASAAAAAGSVSAAAHRLGVSQPAVSRSLSTLESRLDRRLFDRHPGELRPTRDGEHLVRHARLALAEIRQGCEELRALAGERGGALRIGALPLTRVQLVPRAVILVLDRFPQARLAVVDGGYGTLFPAMLHGDLDMLVGTLRAPAAPGVRSERLFDDDVVIVVGPAHPLVRRRRVSLADCLAYPWVLPFGTVPLRIWIDAALAAAGLPRPAQVVEADSIVFVRSLLMSSERIAVLSSHQIAPEVELGLLRALPVPLDPARRPVGVVMRTEYAPTPLAQAYLSALRQAAEEITRNDGRPGG